MITFLVLYPKIICLVFCQNFNWNIIKTVKKYTNRYIIKKNSKRL